MSHGRKLISSLKAQIACVAVLGVATALVCTSFTPLAVVGTAASTGDEPRQIPAPQIAADPSQAEALADGNVARAEYDAAIDRTLACVRSAGGTVKGVRYEHYRDRPVWTFVIRYDRPYVAGMASPYDECWVKYSREVQAKWIDQHEPSAARRADNEARALACASQEGLGVTDMNSLNGLIGKDNGNEQVAVNRCLTIAYKGYDLAEHPPMPAE